MAEIKLNKRYKYAGDIFQKLIGIGFDVETATAFLDEVEDADVAEVKHSRWENISGFDVCNICGTSPAYCEPKPNNPKGYPPYCHNCGAKMDGTPKERGGEK